MKKNRLYLIIILAIFMSASLHSQELKNNKCGTFSPNKTDILNRIFKSNLKDGETLQNREIPDLDLQYTSPKGRFIIHYTLTGNDAVDNIDTDKNNVPDYVDSAAYYLEQAWDYQVDKLGMTKPKSDGIEGGNGLYDVYLADLGNDKELGFYGVTFPDGEIYPTSSYIIIDNNFSEKDGYYEGGEFVKPYDVFGYDALKITCAHEFNHALQFSYNQVTDKTDVLAEMTSVAFEYIMHNEVKDYVNNMNIFLKYPNRMSLFSSEASDGYYWSVLFIKMLESGYSPEFISTFWKNTEKYDRLYDALTNAIKSQKPGSDLDNEIMELADYLYYTNDKRILGKHYKDAEKLNTVKFISTRKFSAPSLMASDKLLPYAFFPMRIVLKNESNLVNDTLSIILINLSKGNLTSPSVHSDAFSYKMTEASIDKDCDTTLVNNKYCFKLQSKNNFIAKYYTDAMSKSGVDYITLREDAFPNPFTGNSQYIAFPIGYNIESDKVELYLYSIEGVCVYQGALDVSMINNTRAALWQKIPANINNGIYIYKISSGENSIFGKISVEKNV